MEVSYYRVLPRTTGKNILVITGGHPFDGPEFYSMLDQVLCDAREWNWTHVEHPAALAFIENPTLGEPYDAYLFYDVPGVEYRIPRPSVMHEPSEAYKAGLEMLLTHGKPMLFMHHAFVGWPKWERYAEIVGGCLVTAPGTLRGRQVADGGYRYRVTHRLTPTMDHPVTRGLERGFELTDQLYLSEVFENEVVPLMCTNYASTADNYYSAFFATQGRMDDNQGWNRPPGSNCKVWAKGEKASPIIYMECGDGYSAYENKGFRTLVGNALDWLTSAEAAEFARDFDAAKKSKLP
jgi:hypothetical protein